MATQTRSATAPLVIIAVEQDGPAAELARALELRGLRATTAEPLGSAVDNLSGPSTVIAFAPRESPNPATAAAIAPICRQAAEAGRPVIALTVHHPLQGHTATTRAATLAYLRANGAILCPDPDTWLEAIVLVAAYGLPRGPKLAVVAPESTWVGLSATALSHETAVSGSRHAPVFRDAADVDPADIALVDRASMPRSKAQQAIRALIVPVVGRAEVAVEGAKIALVGLRPAITAAILCGRCNQRVKAGLGPAPDTDALEVDRERFGRQLGQLHDRAGDHETKVMLASFGVKVTRQAVATTPSAATRVAKKAGWPVEVKPWSPDVPTEPEGCPVEVDLRSAPAVRRAFAAVASAADLPSGSPMIVRETPPRGREVTVQIERMGALGWTLVAQMRGTPGVNAAPAPLRATDAEEIARGVVASRAGDPEPDREALADLLIRASAMVTNPEARFESLTLSRIVVAPRGNGAIVVDARATLRAEPE